MSGLYQRKIQNIQQIEDNYHKIILPKILSSECLGINLCGWLNIEDYFKKPENYLNSISLPKDLSTFLRIEKNTNIIKLIF